MLVFYDLGPGSSWGWVDITSWLFSYLRVKVKLRLPQGHVRFRSRSFLKNWWCNNRSTSKSRKLYSFLGWGLTKFQMFWNCNESDVNVLVTSFLWRKPNYTTQLLPYAVFHWFVVECHGETQLAYWLWRVGLHTGCATVKPLTMKGTALRACVPTHTLCHLWVFVLLSTDICSIQYQKTPLKISQMWSFRNVVQRCSQVSGFIQSINLVIYIAPLKA